MATDLPSTHAVANATASIHSHMAATRERRVEGINGLLSRFRNQKMEVVTECQSKKQSGPLVLLWPLGDVGTWGRLTDDPKSLNPCIDGLYMINEGAQEVFDQFGIPWRAMPETAWWHSLEWVRVGPAANATGAAKAKQTTIGTISQGPMNGCIIVQALPPGAIDFLSILLFALDFLLNAID
ncbi:hypothetical protein CIHG_05453 [Coccidioides immitis H538.4]|uniref:Uncharacterized protein n=1 Tax=Coccidioides immitis H538.4 TaxID=396776 RepID=A0A0J8RSZ3_COCIT|nr:hypothetical protein CIHG_05453 [Coccidioides immitis H538.4]